MADTLILSWTKQGIVASQAAVSGQTVRVKKVAELTWPENSTPEQSPKATGQELKKFLKQAGMQADSAVVCLPRELVVIRRLDVPRVPEDELADIVHMQAITRSSQSAEQLMIDFLPQPSQPGRELGSVLVATLTKSVAQKIRVMLEAAEIELLGLGISSIGLAELAQAHASPKNPGEALVAITLDKSKLEIALIRDHCIQTLQTPPLAEITAERISAELRRILFSAQQQLGEFAVGETIMFVEPDRQAALASLPTQFEFPFKLVGLAELGNIELSTALPQTIASTSLVGPLGLLRNRVLKTLPGIDFSHPREQRVVKDHSRRKMAIYAAGVLTLLGVAYSSFHAYVGRLDAKISQLELDEQTLKQSLAGGKSTLASDAQLQEWLDRDAHLLLELDRVQQTLPGTENAYLSLFDFDVSVGKNLAKVTAEGVATDRNVVEEIYRDFDAAGFDVTPASIGTGRRDSEYPAEFDLNLEQPVQTAKTTSPARSSAK